jgi:hypothetical protein
VFVGQTFVDVPSTVIAQEDRGSIRVLAAFVSEHASLRKHLETMVKPWLLANTRALQDRRLILGAYEDADRQVQWDMYQTIEKVLGGEWEPATSRWESRRDAMLDVIGKAKPFHFEPVLQIDPVDARLLIEALSGRWTYEKDRRNQRNIWWHVANAFSLLIGRAAPPAAVDEPPVTILTDFEIRRLP